MKTIRTKAARGFTLIELLVVVAIIGLLAAVVLASVGGARQKGVNAAVQSSLNSARTQAELFASNNDNKYTGVCGTTAGALDTTNGILTNAAGETGATVVTTATAQGAPTQVTCHDSAAAWVVEAPLSGSATGAIKMWCVDSDGSSRNETSNIAASAMVCP